MDFVVGQLSPMKEFLDKLDFYAKFRFFFPIREDFGEGFSVDIVQVGIGLLF